MSLSTPHSSRSRLIFPLCLCPIRDLPPGPRPGNVSDTDHAIYSEIHRVPAASVLPVSLFICLCQYTLLRPFDGSVCPLHHPVPSTGVRGFVTRGPGRLSRPDRVTTTNVTTLHTGVDRVETRPAKGVRDEVAVVPSFRSRPAYLVVTCVYKRSRNTWWVYSCLLSECRVSRLRPRHGLRPSGVYYQNPVTVTFVMGGSPLIDKLSVTVDDSILFFRVCILFCQGREFGE